MIQQLLHSGGQKQNAEELPQELRIHPEPEPGKEPGADAPGGSGPEQLLSRAQAPLPAKKAGDGRRRKEEKQIHGPGAGLVPAQHQGQPEDQQAAAAHPQAGKKAQKGAHQQGKGEGF